MREKLREKRTKFLAKNHNTIKKIAGFINRTKLEIMGATVGGLSVSTAHATSGNAKNMIAGILDQIITLFPAIGVVIALVGAFKLYMAFRNDQPDAYSGAIKDIVIGALLITFDMLIWKGGANLRSYL